ncbi:hypothetical protein B0H66DRAFT_161118 [Apodospora peruviana]|uniref:Uncharacterized protein n=1 Tax=Apodospora peruviana TaxID=516989 RepID=A0AAE0MBV1_9PEZI|nr:hypothetical protein B0H66DRAFT_161118 [Apodospora peruviana]
MNKQTGWSKGRSGELTLSKVGQATAADSYRVIVWIMLPTLSIWCPLCSFACFGMKRYWLPDRTSCFTAVHRPRNRAAVGLHLGSSVLFSSLFFILPLTQR